MSRPRKIDPFLLVRFVRDYDGEPGRAFREAVAREFGVDARTVERELPRHVAAGTLEETILPGRGAPKAYRVPEGLELGRWRRGALGGLDGLGRRKTTGEEVAAAELGLSIEDFRRGFRAGIVAYCPRCGRYDAHLHPDIETPDCPSCRVSDRAEDGSVTYRARPMLRGDGFPVKDEPTPPPTRGQLAAAEEQRRRLWAKLTRP